MNKQNSHGKIIEKKLLSNGSHERYNEEQLLKMSRLGGFIGANARDRLIRMHYSWIKKRCYQILKNEADACDACQEVAIIMQRSLTKFEGRSSLRTWLNTIIRNESISQIRKRNRHIMSEHLEMLLHIHQRQLREEPMDSAGLAPAVSKILTMLSFENREILILRHFREHTLKEISVILNLKLSTTKMRLYRAMEQFKKTYCQITNESLDFC
jgi:RNA polymerase sigma-70 factor (ECF subfamily)